MPDSRGRRVKERDHLEEADDDSAGRTSVRRWHWLVAVLVSVVATATMALTLALSYEPVTQYDEQAHFDYVARIAAEHRLLSVGEVYGDDAVEEMRCRGIGLEESGEERSTCGPELTPDVLPFRGVNYVASYSPVFYGATALVAGPLSSATGMSLFVASRLACVLWFVLGAGILTLALVRLRVSPALAAGATILLASTPSFVLQGGAVTPDSVSLLAGAGALLILTLRTSWGRRLAIMVAFGVVMGLVKSSFVPLGAVGVLMAVVFPLRGSSRQARWLALGWRRLVAGVVLAALPAVASGLASVWRSSTLAPGASSDGGMSEVLRTTSSLGSEIVLGAIQLLHPLDSVAYIAPPLWVFIAILVHTVLLGGVALVAVHPGLPVLGLARTLAIGAVASWVLMALFLSVTFFVLFHVQGTQGRYALPVMPLFLAAAVLALGDGRRLTIWVGVASAIGCATALQAILAV